MQVAIVGSGVAGLIAGAYLAQRGHQVTVFEQHHRPGGVTAPFERGGYRWDLGQLLVEGFGPDEPIGLILADLGIPDQIRVMVEDRGYVFPDFALKKPERYEGLQWRLNRLKELFPEDADGLDRYWADYSLATGLMTLVRRIEQSHGLAAQYWRIRLYLKALPLLSRMNWSAQQLMDHYFQSTKLKMVFTSIMADFFTAPRDFPGLGIFALNAEASFDKRIPRELTKGAVQLNLYNVLGGMGTLVDALVSRIDLEGGRVLTSRPVARIAVEGGRAKGVIDAEGRLHKADVVIASGGAKETFLKLVGEGSLPPEFVGNLRDIPLMGSVFMLHLGIDMDPSPYVHGVCTYYYGTYDLDRGLADAESGVYHEGRDGFVVHVPSLHSPEMAPEGKHAMTIYTIAPDRLAEGSWADRKEAYADALIGYAEDQIPGLGEHIEVCEILTPEDWRSLTHLDHHAFGGIKPVLGAWRVPHEAPIAGLWFIGQQSESGGGMINVIQGAYKTARRIADLRPGPKRG